MNPSASLSGRPPLRVAWISDFPIEWLPDAPREVRELQKQHPATWEWVLRDELEPDPEVELHVCILRKQLARELSFSLGRTKFHLRKVPGGIRAPMLFWPDTLVLRRTLKTIRPDLVHAWGTERGAALVASRLRYPFIVSIQGLLSWYRDRVPLAPYERFAAWVESWSLRRAPVVTTESRFAVEYLRERYPRTRVHQAEHASNWLFHGVERCPQVTPPRMLCVGSFGYRKGSDLLLRALNELVPETPFEVVVIGNPDEAFLSSFREELSAELWQRIHFRRNLMPAEIASELATATLLVLPTRADTSPNAVKEAVVAGVPVVASAVGGIPDYVFHGLNGILFPPDDRAALVSALREALHHPLFSKGIVDVPTLQTTRDYLSPARMKTNFLAAYTDALKA